MNIERYTIFLDGLELDAEIGIHDFERGRRQRIKVGVEMTIEPGKLPSEDRIADAFDYDWVRLGILDLVRRRRFDLQETLAREIVAMLRQREEIVAVVVTTQKPDVYPDAEAVGCRIEARR